MNQESLVLASFAFVLVGCGTTDPAPSRPLLGEDYELRFLGRMVGESKSRRMAPTEIASATTEAPAHNEARPSPSRVDPGPTHEPTHASKSAAPPGGIAREDIRKVIGSHYPDIQGCYEKQLAKTPKFKGRLMMRFMLGPRGNVLKANVVKDPSTPQCKELEACLSKLAVKWTFPAPADGKPLLVTSDPFVFE